MQQFIKNLNLFYLFLFLVVFSLFFLLPQQTRAEESPLVIISEVRDEIKAGTLQYLQRVIRTTEEKGADYLVIKLDTPGGLLKATEGIVDLILDSPIKIIVFVDREAGWAYSAGTFILLSADYAIVHPRASIGAAQPVVMGAEEAVSEKMIEGMASWMRTLAETFQRNPEIAEKFVRENLALTGQEAKDLKVIDETAKNLDELFLKLNILEPRTREIKPNFIEEFFNFLSHPYLISLFLTIGGLAIIMAIRSGEFELTGIIGIIALLIGLWGMGIIAFSFLGIGLLLLGIILLMIELFMEPGFGILGVIGTIIVVLGIFTFEAEPLFTPELFDAMTISILGTALIVCFLFVTLGRILRKSILTKPKTGPEALIGLRVKVIKELNPRGYVRINQETWSAENVNQETILINSNVEIVKVEGNTIFVKKVEKI